MHRHAYRKFALGILVAFFLTANWAISTARAAEKTPYRMPAPGVMKPADEGRQVSESYSRHDLTELVTVDPKLDWAKNVDFRHDIWTLRFDYKPLRMIMVDIPQKSGKAQRKPIYYLVYRVTNVPQKDQSQPSQYGWMHPVQQPDGMYKVEYQDRPIRFVPEFVLQSPEYKKAYPDRIIPLAMPTIHAREDRQLPAWNRREKGVARLPLQNSVEIAGELAPGQSAWGVAIWEDVDPRIDKIDIYVQGITNAYKWKDDPKQFKPGAKRAEYRQKYLKTLCLHFWQPGDRYDRKEEEIQMGFPGGPDNRWLYLPSLSGR
jgi:hypothetical protein